MQIIQVVAIRAVAVVKAIAGTTEVMHGVLVKRRGKMIDVITSQVLHAAEVSAGAESAHMADAAHAADVSAATETTDVTATAKAAHVGSAAEAAVSAATAATGIRRDREQARGQQGRCQDRNHSFHVITPFVAEAGAPLASKALSTCLMIER